jgi:hypothetical protein
VLFFKGTVPRKAQSNPVVESRVVPPSSSQVHRKSTSKPTNSLPRATASNATAGVTSRPVAQPSDQIGVQSSRAEVTDRRSTDIQLIVSTTSSQLPSPFPTVLNQNIGSSAMIPVQATFARCEGDASNIVDEQQVTQANITSLPSAIC